MSKNLSKTTDHCKHLQYLQCGKMSVYVRFFANEYNLIHDLK